MEKSIRGVENEERGDREETERGEAQKAGVRLAEALSPRNERKNKRRQRLAEKMRMIADMEEDDDEEG